jgi:thioredoxin 1
MENSKLKPNEINDGLVLIKFGSPTCGPCNQLKPHFEELAENIDGVEFLSINPQEDMDWVIEYGIRSIPTTMLFKDKKPVNKVTGNNIDQIKDMVVNNM